MKLETLLIASSWSLSAPDTTTSSPSSQIMSTFRSLSSRPCLIYCPPSTLEPLRRWMRQGDTWRRSWVVKWDVLCCSFTCLSNWTTTTAVDYTIQEKRVLFSYDRRWRRAKNCKKFSILSLFLPLLYPLNAFFQQHGRYSNKVVAFMHLIGAFTDFFHLPKCQRPVILSATFFLSLRDLMQENKKNIANFTR